MRARAAVGGVPVGQGQSGVREAPVVRQVHAASRKTWALLVCHRAPPAQRSPPRPSAAAAAPTDELQQQPDRGGALTLRQPGACGDAEGHAGRRVHRGQRPRDLPGLTQPRRRRGPDVLPTLTPCPAGRAVAARPEGQVVPRLLCRGGLPRELHAAAGGEGRAALQRARRLLPVLGRVYALLPTPPHAPAEGPATADGSPIVLTDPLLLGPQT